jgi:hypothetical protein
VLADHVPVPAVDERGLSPFDQPGTDAWEPAITQGRQVLADESTGYLVLMDGVWNQASGSSSTSTSTTSSSSSPAPAPAPVPPAPPPPPRPLLMFPAGNMLARIKGGNALVKLSCVAAACDGTVRLQSAPAAQAAAAHAAGDAKGKKKHKAAPVVTYASTNFSLPAGVSQAVDAKLSGAGRQLARRHKRLRVWLNVTLANTTPATISSRALTLTF